MAVIRKLKCFFGYHEYFFTTHSCHLGLAVGLKCCHCGAWHPQDYVGESWEDIRRGMQDEEDGML